MTAQSVVSTVAGRAKNPDVGRDAFAAVADGDDVMAVEIL
jgi:hypothetical protein